MVNNLPSLATTFVLSTLLVTLPTNTLSQQTKPVLPKQPPNTQFKVVRQAGTCPKTVGVWTSFRYYEGGGENTVIADTLTIAGPVRLVSSSKKLVEYTAALKKAYASCVGQARSQEYPYRFRFQKGNVAFRVELPADTPANPSEILAQSIVASRPYVRWAIAD